MTEGDLNTFDRIADVYDKRARALRRTADELVEIASKYRLKAQEHRETNDN